jgi:acetyl-CoA C-acetyltransferase
MGIGPEPATGKLLDRTGLGVADLDVIELNESVRLAVAGRAAWPRPACPRRARQPERRGDRARPPQVSNDVPVVLVVMGQARINSILGVAAAGSLAAEAH